MKRLLTLLFFASTAFGQTPVTVTGLITDAGNNPATSGFVQFDLIPKASAIHYFVPNIGTITQTVQCGINGSGQVKSQLNLANPCTVWGNDIINPANTQYKVTFAPNGNITNVVSGECLIGSSYSLNFPVFCPIIQVTPQQAVIRSNPFQVNIIPNAGGVFNVGSPQLPYAAGYFNNLFLNGVAIGAGGGTGTTNTVAKFVGPSVLGNSTVIDDGTNPTRSPLGLNTALNGNYTEWVVDTGGVVINKLACRSGNSKAVICPTSATVGVLGVAQATVSSGGTVEICWAAKCNVISTNAFTAGHWLIPSVTVAGSVDDTGSGTQPTGKQTFLAESSGSGGATVLITVLSPDTVNAASGLLPQYTKLECSPGIGDGLNAIPAGTYLQFNCVNLSGVTWTITAIKCWTDNNGTSTLNAFNNGGFGLITGAVTCTNIKSSGGAAGTLSGITLANNDAISFTFIADGSSKQTTWTVSLTQ